MCRVYSRSQGQRPILGAPFNLRLYGDPQLTRTRSSEHKNYRIRSYKRTSGELPSGAGMEENRRCISAMQGSNNHVRAPRPTAPRGPHEAVNSCNVRIPIP